MNEECVKQYDKKDKSKNNKAICSCIKNNVVKLIGKETPLQKEKILDIFVGLFKGEDKDKLQKQILNFGDLSRWGRHLIDFKKWSDHKIMKCSHRNQYKKNRKVQKKATLLPLKKTQR